MQKIDIRKQKNELRIKSKVYRRNLTAIEKAEMDAAIVQKLFSLKEFVEAQTILCYMSTDIEVDTKKIIERLFALHKTVAVPRCVDAVGNMDFHCITDFNQTEKGTFGVQEPNSDRCPKLSDFANSVCILPGLGFDLKGYRLGYGKGCYDRFLSLYSGFKIGITFEKCIFNLLPHGYFDIAADIVVTEKRIIIPKQV